MGKLIVNGYLHGRAEDDKDISFSESAVDLHYRRSNLGVHLQDHLLSMGMKSSYTDYCCLGHRRSHIDDCSVKLFFSDSKIDEELAEQLAENFDGDLYFETNLTGYSEYTITGMDVDTLEIGGHDLMGILESHFKEYFLLRISW